MTPERKEDDLESQETDQERNSFLSRKLMDIFVVLILVFLIGFLVSVSTTRQSRRTEENQLVPTGDGEGFLEKNGSNNYNIVGSNSSNDSTSYTAASNTTSSKIGTVNTNTSSSNSNNNSTNNTDTRGTNNNVFEPSTPEIITETIFVLLRFDSKNHELISIDFDGSHWAKNNLKKVFDCTTQSNPISYSEDGERIVFLDSGGKLRVFNMESKSFEKINDDFDEVVQFPTINSDGTRILFKSKKNLKTIDFDEEDGSWGQVEVVREFEKDNFYYPTISPDGESFVYLLKSPEIGLYSLHREDPSGNNNLSFEFDFKNNLSFGNKILLSPDGLKTAHIVKNPKRIGKSLGSDYVLIMDMKVKKETKEILGIKPEISYELLKWSEGGNSIYFSAQECDEPLKFYEYNLEEKKIFPLKDENGNEVNL